MGALSGQKREVQDGRLSVTIPAHGGEIWLPEGQNLPEPAFSEEPLIFSAKEEKAEEPTELPPVPAGKAYEDMSVEELQAAILERMARNGPVTEQMRRDVLQNVWQGSLLNWIRSFR